jgi:chromate reductase, NAD(P)H dehydrogenase (quinone)
MEPEIRVLALNGSLRAASYNGYLLRAAAELAPPRLSIAGFDIGTIPLYNADVELAGEPGPVAALREAIRRSGALLIASPEYNYGVPGGLKNAIDWISRPPATSPFQRKPVAILGVSTGPSGTMRMQTQLRTILQSVGAYTLPKPEFAVAHGKDKFDADGRLTDAKTREHLAALLEALVAWTGRF